MALVRNEDLKVLIEIEDLWHQKLVENNAIKDAEGYHFDENDKEYDLWLKYWNIIERFICDKKAVNKRSAEYNKKNAEYHRLSNNLYTARKSKDRKRIEYYTQKLKDLKNK